MRRTSSRIALSAGALALLTLGSACGDDDDDATDASVAATAAAAGTDAAAPTTTVAASAGGSDAPAAGDATVATTESDLGTILVDGEGMTLYLFLPDAQGPSTCTGDCLTAWPALAGPATADEGVDESLLGTAARPEDGAEQVTYNGWPLYHYGGDAAAGDINGQGLGDSWFAVDPSGNAVAG